MKLLKISLGIAVIVILILSLLLYNNIKTNNENILGVKNGINDRLIYHISEAHSGFGVDFLGQKDLNMRNSFYENCIAEVAAVFSLSEVSSIEDKNDLLDIAFGGLYKAMIDERFRVKIMGDQKKIYEILTQIMLNPYEEESTNELFTYVSELYK
jgi:hypothetical protein